jgi:choline dehydrogenase
LHLKSDVELAQIVRQRVETLYHPACSCRMAPLKDGGVVDSQFRVYGISNLRVCDASTFPSIVSGHTVSLYWFCAGYGSD